MPRPRREPIPDDRQAALPLAKAPARRATPTPEAIAKTVTDRDPSPVGMPELAAITLRLALPRAALERLTARAHRECSSLAHYYLAEFAARALRWCSRARWASA